MTSDEIKDEILLRLRQAEQQHEVRVLYAVESGERAWGFAPPGGVHEVRFVYAHPRDWYLCVDLEARPGTIEYRAEGGIKLGGWDVRQALSLLWQSNPLFVEWLHSPLVYRDDGRFAEGARTLLAKLYSVEEGVHHYLKMAEHDYHGYLKAQLVPLERYFRVLRPLLAIRWLERFRSPPPVEFELLRELVADNATVSKDIARLLARRAGGQEKAFIPAMTSLNEFIGNELARFSRYQPPAVDVGADDMAALNALFRDCLAEAEGAGGQG